MNEKVKQREPFVCVFLMALIFVCVSAIYPQVRINCGPSDIQDNDATNDH